MDKIDKGGLPSVAILALWITPKFSEAVERGDSPPPHINHDDIDWVQFGQRLSEALRAPQQGVCLRLSDDTVDAATLLVRQGGPNPALVQCQDFGQALLAVALKTPPDTEVIPARAAWADLHYIRDRQHAPPPSMIPMICTGRQFDLLKFFSHAQSWLNIRAAAMPIEETGKSPSLEDLAGELPESFRRELRETFGVSYEGKCLMHFLIDSAYLTSAHSCDHPHECAEG